MLYQSPQKDSCWYQSFVVSLIKRLYFILGFLHILLYRYALPLSVNDFFSAQNSIYLKAKDIFFVPLGLENLQPKTWCHSIGAETVVRACVSSVPSCAYMFYTFTSSLSRLLCFKFQLVSSTQLHSIRFMYASNYMRRSI